MISNSMHCVQLVFPNFTSTGRAAEARQTFSANSCDEPKVCSLSQASVDGSAEAFRLAV